MGILSKRSILVAFIFLLFVFAALLRSALYTAVAASSFTFKNFELGSIAGTSCPNTKTPSNCTNGAGEPQIRADRNGNFYASSENGLTMGTDAWRSSSGGKNFTTLPSPNALSSSNEDFAPAGGDTDLAVAPAKNSNGFYNVYVASLNLANVIVSTSMNKGKTWTMNPTSATVPGDDREWIAADGASKVCISYHDVATFNIDVNCSSDAGKTFPQLGEAFDTNHLFLLQSNATGNLVIDPHSHVIYQTFSGIANVGEQQCSQQGTCGFHVVYMAVSTDGGKTFTDYPVYNNPTNTVSYGHQFINVSIDSAGNVYSVFCDNHNVYYSYSTDQGKDWSAPKLINAAPSNTAIFPWSVAHSPGHLDIVWYGTSFYDGTTPPDNYPMNASWYVYFAQSLNANTAGSSFVQTGATPVIHYGGVCEGGVSCQLGNRDLYDDFGVAVNPLTGLATIVYSDDQYSDSPTNPARSGCTASVSNSISCEHTVIANQTSGSGI